MKIKAQFPAINKFIGQIVIALSLIVTQFLGQGYNPVRAASADENLDSHIAFTSKVDSTSERAVVPPPVVKLYKGQPLVPDVVQFNSPARRPRFDPTSDISISAPAEVTIGTDFDFTVSFSNSTGDADPATNTGFGPIIDLIFPVTSDNTTGIELNDGIDFVGAKYLGVTVESKTATFPDSGGGTGCVDHSYFKDTTGHPLQVCNTAGNKLVSLRLPFGSVVPAQPAITVNITAHMNAFADVLTPAEPLPILVRGGYMFGRTALDDWCCDQVIVSPPTTDGTGWPSAPITPALITLTKAYNGPENETATGPNFTRQYTITVDIPDGETLDNFTVSDFLPPNMEYDSLVSASPGGGTVAGPDGREPATPGAQNPPDNELRVYWASVTGGTTKSDVVVKFNFFIPRLDAVSGDVINPITGNDVTSDNYVQAQGDWTPTDPDDLPSTVTAGASGAPGPIGHTLNDKSITTQKSVAVVTDDGATGPSPQDVVENTINFQISDYFVFDNVSIIDVISDGQHFDPSFTPTLQVDGNDYTLATTGMDSANYSTSCDYTGASVGPECSVVDGLPHDGKTTLTFNISNELVTRGQNDRMAGGCIDPTTGGTAPDFCAVYDNGPTQARLIYHTIIQNAYTDDYPSGDPWIDQGDTLDNTVTASGRVLTTDGFFTPTGSTEDDASADDLKIVVANLVKSLYKINGANPSGPPYHISPGNTVTYRLTYDMPTSDVEDLYFEDYLPLPVFKVSAYAWTFVGGGGIPAAGEVRLGPSDTFTTYSGKTPTVTQDNNANKLTFTYGNYNGATHAGKIVDLVFTATVSNDPFADKLYLTNLARAHERSTQMTATTSNAIIQIVLDEPALVANKAVVWSDNPEARFSPTNTGPVTFLDPTNTPRWSGTINSTNLQTSPINSNISQVDAGDLITFAIVIQNNGGSLNGAFDIVIKDSMPAQFDIPGTGLNLQIRYGNGAGGITYTQPGGGAAVPNDLFGAGIELVDGAQGVCQAHHPSNGNDIILITYDLQLKPSVSPGTLTNTETLVHYSGTEGGPNYVPATPPTEDATTNISSSPVKTIVTTSSTYTLTNKVAVGEIVRYRLTASAPEATLATVQLRDILPAGLQFLDDGTAAIGFVCNGAAFPNCITSDSPDLSGAGLVLSGNSANVNTLPLTYTLPPASSVISCSGGGPCSYGSGTDPYFELGNVENLDRDPDGEYIVMEFNAVVLNITANQDTTNMDNRFDVYSGGSRIGQSANVRVTVVEPVLTINKVASNTLPVPGNVLTFTLTVEHDAATTTADAHDVVISDILPAGLTLDATTPITYTLTGGASGVTDTSAGNDVEINIAYMPVGSSVVVTFKATVSGSFGSTIDNKADVTWTSLPTVIDDTEERDGADGPGAGLDNYAASDTETLDLNRSLDKALVAHSHGGTGLTEITIGEILTYEVTLTIPPATSQAMTVVDLLDRGLAFVGCDSITPSSPLLTTTKGTPTTDFTPVCTNPIVTTYPVGSSNPADPGRQATFDFGTVENTDPTNTQTIAIHYRVVVLDTIENVDGVSLSNHATWTWTNGAATVSTPPMTIIESNLLVEKKAQSQYAMPGKAVTFTITVKHSPNSHADAYDVTVEDVLPRGLDYVPGTLAPVSGLPPTTLEDSAAPTLRVHWDDFPRSPVDESVVQFKAKLKRLGTGQGVTNVAQVDWTSLPGAIPAILSPYNTHSSERINNPANTPDSYRNPSSFRLKVPQGLPATGFAPGRYTTLPMQPGEAFYEDLGDMWLEIPWLGVKKPIVGVPLSDAGWDLTWLWDQAGHLEGTTFPTWEGNSVLTAHVYTPDGKPGPFVNLSSIPWGESVIVHFKDEQYIYEVREVRRVYPFDLAVLDDDTEFPTLTLLTCQNFNEKTHSYRYRIAVQAVLVKKAPE